MMALEYDLRQLCRWHREGSYATQANREDMLVQMAHQLRQVGYRDLRARAIKGRHVDKLFALWKREGITDQTIRNRLSTLRWWCAHVGRPSVMPKTNEVYQLTPRPQAALVSKAFTLTTAVLEQVSDPFLRLSLQFQAVWGLRREESLKLHPWDADRGDFLDLHGSWCKNGRPRQILLAYPEQRTLVDDAKAFVRFKSHSLIPRHRSYVQHLHRYTALATTLGLPPLHGLRHAFAQRRYGDLAGFPCPLLGGPTRETMSREDRTRDRTARRQVSVELGHERVQIVGMYIGT